MLKTRPNRIFLGCLDRLREAINKEIAEILREPDWTLRHLFDSAAKLVDRSKAESHPEVIVARKAAEAKTAPLKVEVLELEEKIARLQSILREFQI